MNDFEIRSYTKKDLALRYFPSATLLSVADKELLSDLANRLGTSFHMFPDRDAPGERLFMQLREVLPTLHHHQLPAGCKDFSDYYVSSINNSSFATEGID